MSSRRILVLALALGWLVAWSNSASANYVNGTITPPATGPTPDETCLPMGSSIGLRWSYCDVAAALFSFSTVDMTVAGPMPIVLQRVYRSEALDSNGQAVLYPFGDGMNLNYNIMLWSESEAAGHGLTSVDVVLPDGGRVYCGCTQGQCSSPPNPPTGLVFTCTGAPSQTFYGATMQFSSPYWWLLTTKDGTQYRFTYAPAFAPGSLLWAITDKSGNVMQLSYNSTGQITQIASTNGRYINLYYQTINGENVIYKAVDNAGRATYYYYTTYGSQANQTTMTKFLDLDGYETDYTPYTPQDIATITLKNVAGVGGSNKDEQTAIGYTQLPSGAYQFSYLMPPLNRDTTR
jgi:YD repeat-containing protein